MDQVPNASGRDELARQDARISELESRLEFQDETIQKLSDEMVQLQGKLFAQDKQLKRLMDRLKAAAGDDELTPTKRETAAASLLEPGRLPVDVAQEL